MLIADAGVRLMKVFGTILITILALTAFDYQQSGGKYVGAFVEMAKRVGAGVGTRL